MPIQNNITYFAFILYIQKTISDHQFETIYEWKKGYNCLSIAYKRLVKAFPGSLFKLKYNVPREFYIYHFHNGSCVNLKIAGVC